MSKENKKSKKQDKKPEIKALPMNISGDDLDLYLEVKGVLLAKISEIESSKKGIDYARGQYSKFEEFWKLLKDMCEDNEVINYCKEFIDKQYEETVKARKEFNENIFTLDKQYDNLKIVYDNHFIEQIVDGVAIVEQQTLEFCKDYKLLAAL